MRGLMEFKDFGSSVKDVDFKNKVVTGYLSSIGNEDKTKDIIHKGAFTKSLNERRDSIFFLNQHNWQQPHGKFAVLQEDTKGLYFESHPLIDTSYSSDTIKLYQAGILTEHSIGFNVMVDDFDQQKGVRNIREIKLYEGSNVTIGANSETPFTGFKSLEIKDVNEKVKKIMKMLRHGTLTDDGFIQLEIALKQLLRFGVELGKKSLEKSWEPSIDTPKDVKPLIDLIYKNINT